MTVARIRLGRPKTSTHAPVHVPGTVSGNSTGNYEKQAGHRPDGTSTAERSTGINPRAEQPIDPRMPNLSPS
jgi:hypothetical protein